jgi:hypothetical protein
MLNAPPDRRNPIGTTTVLPATIRRHDGGVIEISIEGAEQFSLAYHETEKGFEPVFHGTEFVSVTGYILVANLFGKGVVPVNAAENSRT